MLLLVIYIYIYAFSRRFYPKRLTIAFRLYIFISMCVPWESNPQPFALLTQCSTTELTQCSTTVLSQTCRHIIIFFLVLNTKLDILKKVCNQTVACPQTKKKKKAYGSQWGPATVWLPTFFKIKIVQQKKATHLGLKQLESEQMITDLYFWGELSI